MAREIVKSYFALPTWVKSVFQLEKSLISCVAEDKANSWQILFPQSEVNFYGELSFLNFRYFLRVGEKKVIVYKLHD